MRDIFGTINYTYGELKIFEKYEAESYLAGYGLVVNRKFRGQGIAVEMLKARVPFLKALGMTLTSTAFTVVGSQKAAKYAGYSEDYEIR